MGGMDRTLHNLKHTEHLGFVTVKRAAQLIGCSEAAIRKGFEDGNVPFCTPFASCSAKRPTRYVDVLAWQRKAGVHHG